ncbi:citrate synthase, mitochondrial [Tanacetum coccineum]
MAIRMSEACASLPKDRLKKIKSEYGKDQLGNITVDMVLGGLRGMTGLLWETSLLNPDEKIHFRGLSIPECQQVLPAAKPGGEPLPEGLLWLLLTVKVPTKEQVDALSAELRIRANILVCVGWVAQRGTSLAVGTRNGKVQIWDAAHYKSILQRDPRAQEAFVSKLNGHKSEVCGLKWSYDNREIASGGNDNMRQSQMSASNNMQLPTHSVLSVVMDVVSEGLSQYYVSYHMHFQQHNLNSMRNDQSGRSASDSIYDVRSPVSEHGHTGHVLRASEGSVDAPADQNLRPTGHMRGSLMGCVYSDALIQKIILPTEPVQLV